MISTLGIVHVRPTALGDKVNAARKLASRSWLELVVRLVTDCERLEQVIVVVDVPADLPLVRQLVPPDVPIWSGDERDPLARIVATTQHYAAAAMVRVGMDNPFVDPLLIDRLVAAANEDPGCDYAAYCSRDGGPSRLAACGVSAEWCRADALEIAAREARSAADRQQVTSFVYRQPHRFSIRSLSLPTELDRGDMRLTVETEEDWENAQVIFEALGQDELDWRRIARLLWRQPTPDPADPGRDAVVESAS